MGRFGWFITGLILGIIAVLGAQLYLRVRDEAPPQAKPAEAEALPASTMVPEPAVGGTVTLAPPKAAPPPRPARPVFRAAPQAADEVAEDAAAVGMTSRRPSAKPKPAPAAAPPADDDVPY